MAGAPTIAADDGSVMDDDGWFNPLVYQGGARLRPRLRNLEGQELPRMLPVRVQDEVCLWKGTD